MERVEVAPKHDGFVLRPSGRPFLPWGFNYDHDQTGRLLEDYWDKDWDRVVEDFREMKELKANVVRIHLQFGRFMTSPDRANPAALRRLGKWSLAEHTGLYLDLTASVITSAPCRLADALEKRPGARKQSSGCSGRAMCAQPAIFYFDLMNEPVVAGGPRGPGEWRGLFRRQTLRQFITLNAADRETLQVAREWIQTLVTAIRAHDQRHLITVGLVDWSLIGLGCARACPNASPQN